MNIKRLAMTHFKGATANYDIPDKGIQFLGKTGAGKTTILEAITFCLFGKGMDREEIKPKPLNDHNEVITCDTEVELETDKGTFKRVFREKWTIPRGKSNSEFSGHETEYYLDDLPVQAREYNETVNSIFSEEQFYMTAIPTYFGSDLINWKDRRRILSQLFEQPSDAELIAAEKDLAKILDGSPPDVHEKKLLQAKASLKKVNEDRKALPDRIDELQRLVKEVEPIESLNAELEELNTKKEKGRAGVDPDLQKQKEDLIGEESRLRQEKTEKLRELSEKYSRIFDDNDSKYGEKMRDLKAKDKEMRKLRDEYDDKKSRLDDNIRKVERDIKDKQDSQKEDIAIIARNKKTTDTLESQLNELTPETENCPTCGQKLPVEYIEKELENAKARLQQKIESINKETRQNQERGETLLRQLGKDGSTLLDLKALRDGLTDGYSEEEHQFVVVEITSLQEKLKIQHEKTKAELQHESDLISGEYESQIAETQGQWQELTNAVKTVDTNLIDAEIELCNEKINQHRNNEDYRRRIRTLEGMKKDLGQQAEELLQEIYLYELRLRTVAKIIEKQINDKFKIARFKLFHIQANGEVQEVCDVLYNGKATMSTGEAIYVGTDIAETLAKHWNISPALLVDGMQNITLDLLTDRQKILTKTTIASKLIMEEL